MHASSHENMRKCYQRYVRPAGFETRAEVIVLDLGGADVNGSYRDLFAAPAFRYLTADLTPTGVDIPLTDPYQIPLPDASVDIVLSGQMLEHCEYFWLAFQEMVRLLKPDGYLFLIAPSAGPIHRYPVDCYRFYPDAYAALARLGGCHLEAVWRDPRGPWQDLVGVFRHAPLPPPPPAPATVPLTALPGWDPDREAAPELEVCTGAQDYLTVLARVHERLEPGGYLEIGVRHGRSLALARCPALGIDPAPAVDRALEPTTQVVAQSSDDFFDAGAREAQGLAPDLLFIDGLHLFEYALRDFMHLERLSRPASLLIIDDIFPNHPAQAERERRTRVWTGDVWKLALCLAERRPDLYLLALDTWPSGLLLVAGLDASNEVLWRDYNPLVRHYHEQCGPQPPAAILERAGALAPASPLVGRVCDQLRQLRGQGAASDQVMAALRALSIPWRPVYG